MIINVLEKLGWYESSLPRMCILNMRMLWPRIDSVCMYQVERIDQMPLTDDHPHLEYHWKVSGLNGGQANTISIAEDTDQQK